MPRCSSNAHRRLRPREHTSCRRRWRVAAKLTTRGELSIRVFRENTRDARCFLHSSGKNGRARSDTARYARVCGTGGGGEQSSAGRHIRHIVVAFAIRDLAIRRRWSCLVVYI